jgi:hypothetical protein
MAGWIALSWAAQQTPRLAAAQVDGSLALGWRAGARYLLPTAVVGPLFVLLAFAKRPQGTEGWVVLGSLLALCVGAWTVLHMMSREAFTLTDSRGERRSPWTGRRTPVDLTTLARINLENRARIVLVTSTGQRMALSHRLDGIGDLAEVLLREAPDAIWAGSAEARALLVQIAAYRLRWASRARS